MITLPQHPLCPEHVQLAAELSRQESVHTSSNMVLVINVRLVHVLWQVCGV